MGCSGLGSRATGTVKDSCCSLERKERRQILTFVNLHGALCDISAFVGVGPVESAKFG